MWSDLRGEVDEMFGRMAGCLDGDDLKDNVSMSIIQRAHVPVSRKRGGVDLENKKRLMREWNRRPDVMERNRERKRLARLRKKAA